MSPDHFNRRDFFKATGGATELDDLGEDGTGGQATGPRVPGRIGNAVKLNGVGDHIALPAGIVSGLADFTIATWINPAATPTWSRVFDFGTGTGVYMFLTVNAGAGPRFAIITGGNGAEQQLNGTTRPPLGTWTHIAVTHTGTTGTLYVNGVAVATNDAMTLRPADLGATNRTWIGRSQFADPLLNATIDDFHIYDRIGRSQNPADPFLNGAVDDFRIYQRGLPAGELAGVVVPGLINSLIDHIAGQGLQRGVEQSLITRLDTASVLLLAGQPARAVSAIDGFIGKVEDLRGGGLSDALATDLVTSAKQITANITASTA